MKVMEFMEFEIVGHALHVLHGEGSVLSLELDAAPLELIENLRRLLEVHERGEVLTDVVPVNRSEA